MSSQRPEGPKQPLSFREYLDTIFELKLSPSSQERLKVVGATAAGSLIGAGAIELMNEAVGISGSLGWEVPVASLLLAAIILSKSWRRGDAQREDFTKNLKNYSTEVEMGAGLGLAFGFIRIFPYEAGYIDAFDCFGGLFGLLALNHGAGEFLGDMFHPKIAAVEGTVMDAGEIHD